MRQLDEVNEANLCGGPDLLRVWTGIRSMALLGEI